MALANTIPFEISSKIFIDCLPPHGQRHLTSTAAPLLLAQVCQRWRAVASSTPSLWNSVDLESNWSGISSREDPLRPSDEDDDHATMNCLLLDLWFSRAGELPLSLTITCAFVLGPSARIHPSILAALAAYAPRCHRIEISMSSWDFCSSIQEIRGPFPLLQALDITVNDAAPTVPLTAFHPAPNLRTLRLTGSLNPPSFGDIGSPEPQSLTLTFWMNFPQCIEILQRFPHLRHLSLPSIDSAILARPSVLPISELRTLECSSHLLRVIAFPRLQSLTIPLPSDADAQRLARFLASPSCQIQELAITIEFSGISDEALYQCLSAGSTFVQLTLRFHVSRTSWRIPGLPQLRTLRIFDVGGPDYSYEALLSMISQRNLSRVEIFLRDNATEGLEIATPRPHILSALAARRAEGCSVLVLTESVIWPEWRQVDDAVFVELDTFVSEGPQVRRYHRVLLPLSEDD